MPAASLTQLQHHGVTQISVENDVAEIVAIAVNSFQGQLKVCSKQQPGKRHTGYRSFSGKHRLEFQPGAAHATGPRVLQGMFSMFSQTLKICKSRPAWLNECVLRGLRHWINFPEEVWHLWLKFLKCQQMRLNVYSD